MFERALKFRRVLDKQAGGPGKANFMFLGDLNTMGMNYPFDHGITAEVELKKLDAGAKRAKMRRLTKNGPHTWWNGPQGSLPPSNLDHGVAADHLRFRQFTGAEIDVRGWPTEPEPKQGAWIERYSDHALLFVQIERL